MKKNKVMSDDFKELVKKCAENDLNQTIFNATSDHALVLFEEIFDKAIQGNLPLKISSGCVQESFYDKLDSKIEAVLKAGISVFLVHECSESQLVNNKFYNTVVNHPNGRTARTTPGNPHFVLAGDNIYRLETDDVLKSARANFNDDVTGSLLSYMFGSIAPQLSI